MPTLVVTENWSGRRFSFVTPFTAEREFVVTGTDDELEALAATGIPQRNDGHPNNPARLHCSGPYVKDRQGVEYWVIGAIYTVDTYPDVGEDPLEDPIKISWRTVEVTEPVDVDLDFRPMLYSTGTPIGGGMPRRITFKQLEIIKNFPTYDLSLSRDYENAVNDAPVSLSGVLTVAAQHFRCDIIEPAKESYTPAELYLPIRFVFSVISEGVLGTYPFQHRALDVDRRGWYIAAGSNRSALFTTAGEPVDFDVRLDGAGIPLVKVYGAGAIKVANQTPAAPNTAVTFYKREWFKGDGTLEANLTANTEAVVLYYKAARVKNLSPLLGML